MNNEPLIGIKGIRIPQKEGKVIAFVDIIMPTQEFGDITVPGCKVINGINGLFVSLPSRKIIRQGGLLMSDTGVAIREIPETVNYYNNIGFQETDNYNKFANELKRVVIPAVQSRLKNPIKKPNVEKIVMQM